MYLATLTAQQASEPSFDLTCLARIQWTYGDQRPDVMEFWWKGGSDTQWSGLVQPRYVDVTSNVPAQEGIFTVPAGVPGMIIACPRMKDENGNLQYKQPHESGEEIIWNSFCLFTQFVGRRLEEKPKDRCRVAPTITDMELGYGSVTVHWNNPEGYDKFEVEFRHTEWGQSKTVSTENLHHKFIKLPMGGCWAKVSGIHEDNSWTGFPGCRSPWSDIKETTLPAELGYNPAKFSPGTPLGAVRAYPGHQEIFGCLPDGSPVGNWADNAMFGFKGWYGHGSGPGPGFPPSAPLTALSRDEGFMDLFGVANDGRVYLAWWNESPWQEWFMLSDSDFPKGAFIAAISRNSDQMDIFAIGSDGVVRNNWWNGDPWREWNKIDGATFQPGAPISAITRNADQMDIFAIGPDGIVRSNWWNGNPWRGWFELRGVDFPPGAPVAAITRHKDQMDIFAVGNDGIMRNNWWNGNPWRGWNKIDGMSFPPGAFVSAIPNGANQMLIQAVGTDGNFYFNIWAALGEGG